MRFWTTIGVILVLSAVGLTYEIAAGRVLAPFFGTSLVTWTTVIAVVLAGFSIGSAVGGLIAERERSAALRDARVALIATAVLMGLSPAVLGAVYASGARGTAGMTVAVVIAFLPASILVTLPSPLLAKMAIEARPGREGSSLGMVLAAGSLGAIAGAILAGFVALPLFGSVATFAGCGLIALLCVPFLPGARGPAADGAGGTDGASASGSAVAVLLAGLVLALAAGGGAACRYESGLSCIDVRETGGAIHLYSDRAWQAGEPRAGADAQLVLPYTRWIWSRMEADMPADADVLFIGGGGYTLPAKLLAERPDARATAVEIDPLVTRVVREHLPWAAGTIEREADAGGRLRIVHADGRVHVNEATETYDAAVLDAFSSDSVPAHLITRETFERLRAIVRGPVYVNLIDHTDGPLARGAYATLSAVWPHVTAVRGPIGASGRTNIVLAASPGPLSPLPELPGRYAPTGLGPGDVFTDDRGWTGHR